MAARTGSAPARTARRRTAAVVAGVLALTAAACGSRDTPDATSPLVDAQPAAVIDSSAAVAAVPHRQVGAAPTMRLADGLLPPTNRWFSGLVFGDTAQPVFPMPLAVTVTADGVAVGLPTPVTSADAIIGAASQDVALDVGASTFEVSAYDTASVTLTLRDDAGSALGTLTLVQGVPWVSYTAAADQDVTVSVAFSGTVPTATVDGKVFALATDGTLDGDRLELKAGQSAAVVAAPQTAPGDDAQETLKTLTELALDPVTGTTLAHAVADDTVSTAITYTTAGGGETAFVRMAHQQSAPAGTQTADCSLGTYATVYGTVDLCRGTTAAWTAPTLRPAGELDLSGLDEAQRAELAEQVRADIAAIPAAPSDTYFGGKALYRDTNLLVLATQLGLDDVAAPLRTQLTERLVEWSQADGCTQREARCFVYDDAVRGVVGLTPSFGSEEFNDHHFHYGYFLYAAGVLGADDPALVDQVREVMDLLAADIAAPTTTADFPALRVFDAYAGHSWASGFSPFADGNNQESSSEAVTAWNGLGLWAQASGNDGLAGLATWLLSAEADSARAYWTDIDLDDPVLEGFDHTIASLNWGAKRDYATWFSPEPSAMLGILVLPMSPVSGYLAQDPDRIRTNLTPVVGAGSGTGYDVMFGDYLLMYSALAGPQDAADALVAARALPDSRIDDGNTRSYLLASVMAAGG